MQLIVLGMHRSGTSAVTRLINMMGAYFGPDDIATRPNEENPKGFWERKDVRQANDELLWSADADWHRVSRFDVHLVSSHARERFRKAARKAISDLDTHRPWVIKEPRLCLLLPLWLELLDDPLVVYVHRSPIQVAQSLRRRNGFGLHVGIALWERYAADALRFSHDLPGILVKHEDVMKRPVASAEKLFEELRAQGVSGLRPPDARAVRSFIDPALFRQRGIQSAGSELTNGPQQRLLEALSGSLRDAQDRVVGRGVSSGGQEILQEFERGLSRERELIEARDRCDDLQKRLTKADALAAQCEAQVSALRHDTKESDALNQRLRTQMNDLAASNTCLQRQVGELARTLEAQRAESERRLSELAQRAEKWEQERSDWVQKRQQLQEQQRASTSNWVRTCREAVKSIDKARGLVTATRRSRRWRVGDLIVGLGQTFSRGQSRPFALDHLEQLLLELDDLLSECASRGIQRSEASSAGRCGDSGKSAEESARHLR